MERNTSVHEGTAPQEPSRAEWISPEEAREILDFTSKESVRNAAWRGAFGERGVGWRRRASGRGVIEYRRAAVEAYRDRSQSPATAGAAS